MMSKGKRDELDETLVRGPGLAGGSEEEAGSQAAKESIPCPIAQRPNPFIATKMLACRVSLVWAVDRQQNSQGRRDLLPCAGADMRDSVGVCFPRWKLHKGPFFFISAMAHGNMIAHLAADEQLNTPWFTP